MGAMASQITSLTIVYSTVYSHADQRKHQSSASLVFVRGIHRSPVNPPHKGPVTRKMFPFDDVITSHPHGWVVRCPFWVFWKKLENWLSMLLRNCAANTSAPVAKWVVRVFLNVASLTTTLQHGQDCFLQKKARVCVSNAFVIGESKFKWCFCCGGWASDRGSRCANVNIVAEWKGMIAEGNVV